MNIRLNAKSGTRSWLRSLPYALAIPVPFWFIGEFLTGNRSELLSSFMFMLIGVSIVVHALSYGIIGLPFFAYFFKKPTAKIWHPCWLAGSGFILGVVTFVLVLVAFGYSRETFEDPLIYLIGAGYGLVTGAVAHAARPIMGEQAVPPKSDRAGG